MKMTRIIAAAVAALGLAATAHAAGDGKKPEHHHWHHAGPFGTYDRAAVQRGFQIYTEVCSSCHGLAFLSFRNLGEEGGPFYGYIPDGDDHGGHHVQAVNANDNPIVMQIAANWRFPVVEIDPETGDPIERAPRASDRFPGPFPNDAAARASNGGALPPDLSLIVKARSHGADYLRSLMLGYSDEIPEDVNIAPGQYYNEYFPGGAIAMPPQLIEGLVEYSDGTEATVEQMAEDITVFLAWAADPHMEARKRMGAMVMIFLFLFAVVLYLAYRQVWANVKH